MQIQTVLGPISREDLGVCLVHEHVLLNLTCLFSPPANENRSYLIEETVSSSIRDELAIDPYQCRDNLVLDDAGLAVRELDLFKQLGGGTVIDLSSRTIGPYAIQLADIARDTGLNIIAGTGFYIQKAHPTWIKDADIERVEDFMLGEIFEGIDGSGIRAGIIGEIGSSSPIMPGEEKVLKAAARVQAKTGLAVNVHLSIFGREGHAVLNLLEENGADISRVALSHVDEANDIDYARSLARRGAFIELDTFGSEFAFAERGQREPNDWQRIDLLLQLIEDGLRDRILVSQDVCNKIHLTEYGGYGYGHILAAIVPRLRKRDIDDDTIDSLLVRNPADMLAGRVGARCR